MNRNLPVIAEGLLNGNQDMAKRQADQRLSQTNTSNYRTSVTSYQASSYRDSTTYGSEVSILTRNTVRFSTEIVEGSIRELSFQGDLEDSRPYRRTKRETVDFSFRSSVALSQ